MALNRLVFNPCTVSLYSSIINEVASVLPAAQSYCSSKYPLLASTTTLTSFADPSTITHTSVVDYTSTSTQIIVVTRSVTSDAPAVTTIIETDSVTEFATKIMTLTIPVPPVTITVCPVNTDSPSRLKRGAGFQALRARAVTTKPPTCNADNCYRALVAYERTSTNFCNSYMKATNIAQPTALATCGASKISSACTCLPETTLSTSTSIPSSKSVGSSSTTKSTVSGTSSKPSSMSSSSTKASSSITTSKPTLPIPISKVPSSSSTSKPPPTPTSSLNFNSIPFDATLCSCIETPKTSTVTSTSTPVTIIIVKSTDTEPPLTSMVTQALTTTVFFTPILSQSMTSFATLTITHISTVSASASTVTVTAAHGVGLTVDEPAGGACECEYQVRCDSAALSITAGRTLITADSEACLLACDFQSNCRFASFNGDTNECAISTSDIEFGSDVANSVFIINSNSGGCAGRNNPMCLSQ